MDKKFPISRNKFILLSIVSIWPIILVYFFPKVLTLTDYDNYSRIFSGTAEDTGFYPLFIIIKEFYRLTNLDYSIFQIFNASLYSFSILFIFYKSPLSPINKLKNKFFLELLIVFSTFISFYLLKSFNLIKVFLAISWLNISITLFKKNTINYYVFSSLSILISPLAIFPNLFIFSNFVLKIRNYFIKILFDLKLKFNSIKIKFNSKNFLKAIAILIFIFVSFELLNRSPAIDLVNNQTLKDALLTSFEEKVDAYKIPGADITTISLLILMAFLFSLVVPLNIIIWFVVLVLSLGPLSGRLTIFIPICIYLINNKYLNLKYILLILFYAYSIFKGLINYSLII